MLEWSFPLALLALPLPLLLRWLAPPRRERSAALRVPFFRHVIDAAGAQAHPGAVVRRQQRWKSLLAMLVWSLLVAALARPQWLGEAIVRKDAARDVMLAIDLSASMDYRDFPAADGSSVSRFEAVQRVVDRFVAGRDQDRVGLIVFGDRAYLQLPFTRDLQTARDLVGLMAVGMAGARTAIGDAIGLAIHAFAASQVTDRLLILLTDGNDTGSRMTPLNAAEIAARRGVEIYTIGIGDIAASGQDRVDFAILADIAERSGGQFFNAEDETALAEVYARIDAAAVADLRTQSWRPRHSLLHWPLGAALLLILGGQLLTLLPASRRIAA